MYKNIMKVELLCSDVVESKPKLCTWRDLPTLVRLSS
jgi:hypothetical protein